MGLIELEIGVKLRKKDEVIEVTCPATLSSTFENWFLPSARCTGPVISPACGGLGGTGPYLWDSVTPGYLGPLISWSPDFCCPSG